MEAKRRVEQGTSSWLPVMMQLLLITLAGACRCTALSRSESRNCAVLEIGGRFLLLWMCFLQDRITFHPALVRLGMIATRSKIGTQNTTV
jgi:hypothetical protein